MRIAQQVQPYLIGGPNIKTTQNFVVGSVSLHGFAANRLVGNPLKICVAVPFLLVLFTCTLHARCQATTVRTIRMCIALLIEIQFQAWASCFKLAELLTVRGELPPACEENARTRALCHCFGSAVIPGSAKGWSAAR